MWLAVLFQLATAMPAAAADTVLYVVRHAEKAAAPKDDPPLSPEGQARAAALARTLTDVPLTAIHSTDTARTRTTAAPLATVKGLEVRTYDADKPVDLVARLKSEGGQHLIVGHSNTIDVLVAAAGGERGQTVADTEFDRLYVVVLPQAGRVTTVQLRYGGS